MSAQWVTDERVRDMHAEHLNGESWYDAGKAFRALPQWRRAFHKHAPQTRAWWDDGLYLERCVCGAYGDGEGNWRMRL